MSSVVDWRSVQCFHLVSVCFWWRWWCWTMDKVFEMHEKGGSAGLSFFLSLSFSHSFSDRSYCNSCSRKRPETNPMLFIGLCLKYLNTSLKFSEKCILFPSFICSWLLFFWFKTHSLMIRWFLRRSNCQTTVYLPINLICNKASSIIHVYCVLKTHPFHSELCCFWIKSH